MNSKAASKKYFSVEDIENLYISKGQAKIIKKVVDFLPDIDEKHDFEKFKILLKKSGGAYEIEIEDNWLSLENFFSLAIGNRRQNKIQLIILFEKLNRKIESVATSKKFLETYAIDIQLIEKEFKSWGHFLELLGYDPWYRNEFKKKSTIYNKNLKQKSVSEKSIEQKQSDQLDFLSIRKNFLKILEKDSENAKLFENIENNLSVISTKKLKKFLEEN